MYILSVIQVQSLGLEKIKCFSLYLTVYICLLLMLYFLPQDFSILNMWNIFSFCELLLSHLTMDVLRILLPNVLFISTCISALMRLCGQSSVHPVKLLSVYWVFLHGCDRFALKGEMLISVCISCIVSIDATSANEQSQFCRNRRFQLYKAQEHASLYFPASTLCLLQK